MSRGIKAVGKDAIISDDNERNFGGSIGVTVSDYAARLGVGIEAARYRLKKLRSQGQAHVSGWLASGSGGIPEQIWTLAQGDDVAMPKPAKRRDRAGDWATSNTASVILCHMETRMLSVKEAAYVAGVNIDAARKHLKQMQSAGVVHVGAWISSCGFGGHPTMQFALGPGVDAVKPPRQQMTKAEKAAEWKRWADSKRVRFGRDVAHKMLVSRRQGGADRIVIDGRVIYERRAA